MNVRPALASLLLLFPSLLSAAEVAVSSVDELNQAARAAAAGTIIRIAPGEYRGGFYFVGLSGTAEKPIVIEAADAKNPPVFTASKGGNAAFHLSGCSHVILRHLRATGFPANGINADEGGEAGKSSTGLRFEDLTIENTGPRGNHDALKLSGLTNFVVKDCTFAGWGGSGIDMVGCHQGVIEGCTFTGREGFSQDNGVQMKGGSADIVVRGCFFNRAGQRAVNLGGSTGLPYFRPADATWEAKNVEVTGCRFTGSLAPVCWVGIDGGHVHHNTIHLPEKWVLRILQENTDARFVPSRNGRFEKNLIVFDRRVQIFANIGPGTEPATFSFAGNAWFCVDDPRRGPRDLPAAESSGLTGVDPKLDGELRIGSDDPRLKGIGAR